MAKKWTGSVTTCNLCHTTLSEGKVMIDGKTQFGPWACMCESCHESKGFGLGTGLGQRYELKGEEWMKTVG